MEKSDADNLSTLFDHNVTRGALKNLVTDKPSPITVGLAQVESHKHAKKHAKTAHKHHQKKQSLVQGDKLEGMKGDEEIHGPATVGGNGVRYA